MRVAVVGHVEWLDFLEVDAVPSAGQIVHATGWFAEPAGGGPVTAVQLARLAGGATLLTALGDDELGHRSEERLRDLGLDVRAVFRPVAQRRAVTFLDGRGERTITVMGDRLGPNGADPLPWDALRGADGVYFTAGDRAALERARGARVLVATSRVMPLLREAGVPLDAVVGSARDPAERYEPMQPPPAAVVLTEGPAGGTWTTADGQAGRWEPAPVLGPIADAYGCGDSFAGGLTFGLASGMPIEAAVGLAAVCGATCLTGRGPYERQHTRA
jgi:ribokinase